MLKRTALTVIAAAMSAGCATVPMEGKDASSQAKLFNAPSQGQAGLYIFRASGPGGALKKDIWVDGKCLGESAPNVFFFTEVAGNDEHTISTESEFSPNDLRLTAESNKNYFVEQYIKMGAFVGGANLRVVGEENGKERVRKLGLATKGTCSTAELTHAVSPESASSISVQPEASPAQVTAQTSAIVAPSQPDGFARQLLQHEVGQNVILSATELLYDGPTLGSRTTELTTGTEVLLKDRLTNASGTWWFVSAQGQIGWLTASSLGQGAAIDR
ncbi:MAG: DUF2846 domain-containing protein [Sinimarinibacterium sp.]|jgi:hypothetical protein